MENHRRLTLAFVAMLLLVLAACGDDGPPDVAVPVPTPSLANAPGATDAQALLPAITREMLDRVTRVCLRVNQIGDSPASIAFNEAAGLLQSAGLHIAPGVDCGTQNTDAIIDLDIALGGIGAKYEDAPGTGFCYTAASATGTMTITVAGAAPATTNHYFTSEAPRVVYDYCPQTAADAPLEGPARLVIYQALADTWGMSLFNYAWASLDVGARATALRACSAQSPDLELAVKLSKDVLASADHTSSLYAAALQALSQAGAAAAAAAPELTAALELHDIDLMTLDDKPVTIADKAMEALAGAGPGAQIAAPVLIERLQSAECRDGAAANALARIGGEPAIAVLFACIDAQPDAARTDYLRTLIAVDRPLAPDVARALHERASATPESLAELYFVYAAFGPTAVEVADELLDAAPATLAPGGRAALVRTLAWNEEAIPWLIDRYATESDPSLRLAIVEALVSQQVVSPSAIKLYGSFLADFPFDTVAAEAAQTKQAVFRTLQTLGPPATPITRDLIKLLTQNGKPQADGEAITTLHRIGPGAVDAVPALIRLLKVEQMGATSSNIGDALTSITGQHFGTDANAWEAWWLDYLERAGITPP